MITLSGFHCNIILWKRPLGNITFQGSIVFMCFKTLHVCVVQHHYYFKEHCEEVNAYIKQCGSMARKIVTIKNFSEHEGRLRIVPFDKLGCFESTAKKFLAYIASISLTSKPILNLMVHCSSPCLNKIFRLPLY